MKQLIRSFLAHPLTKGMDINDPYVTELRQNIIAEKNLLNKIYNEIYGRLFAEIPPPTICNGLLLELGAGGSSGLFIKERERERERERYITSDVFPVPGIDMVINAMELPFDDRTLRGIIMKDVLHHIPNVRLFLREADRCLNEEGVIAMMEPWNGAFARFFYHNFHNEPFEPSASHWELDNAEGPLSSANQALAWIIFHRDLATFQQEFPRLHLKSILPDFPFSYMASGGVSMRSFCPGWLYRPWRIVEKALPLCILRQTALSAFFTLTKRSL